MFRSLLLRKSILRTTVSRKPAGGRNPFLASASYPRLFSVAKTEEDPPPFSKVLIANRGEISQRVASTCKELGIETVAIYSTADAKAPFVQAADEAICVGPAASSDSYLNVPNVLQAIRDTGAQAVHPGYGFLSENAEFCKSIEGEGVVWLGPPVSASKYEGCGEKVLEEGQNYFRCKME